MNATRGRKRTSQACLPCGKRKTKCDGSVPICRQCQTNDRECRYGFSKRNKLLKWPSQKRSKTRLPVGSLSSSEPVVNVESNLQQPSPELQEGQAHNHDDEARTLLQRISVGAGITASPTVLRPSSRSSNDVVVGWDVSKRLFDAYFAYIHPVWPILYKPKYDSSDHRSLSDQLPQPVVYAVYSIAACLKLDAADPLTSSEPETPHPSLFFEAALLSIQRSADGSRPDRANYFHPLHLLRPSLENCQALTILALQQHGFAEPANAFMLCSLASAMAIELELHKAKMVEKDAIQAQVESRLWWNVFVLDKMIACELGRPCMLRSEDSNAPMPSTAESDEYQLLQFHFKNTNSMASIKSFTLSGFHFTIGITKIMEKVSRQIYSLESRETIKNNLHAGEQVRVNLSEELRAYHTSLNMCSSDSSTDVLGKKAISPAFVTNAVWAWTMMILVQRPFYSYWQKQNWLPGQSLPSDSQPLEISFLAADKICQILEAHVENLQKFPCDLIFPIFTTASTLLHYKQIRQGTPNQTSLFDRLAMCIRWLSILGSNWKIAGKSKSKLTEDLDLVFRHDLESNAEVRTPCSQQGVTTTSNPDHDSQASAFRPAEHTTLDLEGIAASEMAEQDADVTTSTDWAFLDRFGDTDDEFFAMDTRFRNFLDAGLPLTSD